MVNLIIGVARLYSKICNKITTTALLICRINMIGNFHLQAEQNNFIFSLESVEKFSDMLIEFSTRHLYPSRRKVSAVPWKTREFTAVVGCWKECESINYPWRWKRQHVERNSENVIWTKVLIVLYTYVKCVLV